MGDTEHEQGSEETSDEPEETTEDAEPEGGGGMERDPLSDYRTEG
jgi:hypothetical protein